MADCRQQTWIDAPVEQVWDLIQDVGRHPEWWPRVVSVECEGISEGCTYREVTKTPFGYEKLEVLVAKMDECQELRIRCVNTGTFVDFALAEARGGTFVDARFGIEPKTLQTRVFDLVAGKRYFRRWLAESLEAMEIAAKAREPSQAASK